MDEIINQIAKYHQLWQMCLIGAVICLIISVIVFRKLQIREVIRFFKRHYRKTLVLVIYTGVLFSNVVLTEAETISNEEEEIEIDTECPAYEAVYQSESGEILCSTEDGTKLTPYYNAAKEIILQFTAIDQNLDFKNSEVKVLAFDHTETLLENVPEALIYNKTWEELTMSENEGEGESQTIQLKFASDAHYVVEIKLVDVTGNETIYQKTFALDHHGPEIESVDFVTESGEQSFYNSNYLDYQHFTKEKTFVCIKGNDTVSGVKSITYSYEDLGTNLSNGENGNEITEVTETVDTADGEIVVELPVDFKGTIELYAEDLLGNISTESVKYGAIVESKEKHLETAKASIEVLTPCSKTPGFYAGDVQLKFSIQDSYSGIKSASYLAGNDWKETDDYTDQENIATEEIVKTYTIAALENEQNDVPIALSFMDNAGHETEVSEEELPQIHIDITKPEIEVEYDNVDAKNEKYYSEKRTATIYVTDKNFDPEDVHFKLSGPTPVISGWKQQGDSIWTCQVEFSEDGEYSFGFSCVDLAGNEGSYRRIDEFVIDKTEPIVIVSYDNHQVRNNYYYRNPRRAIINIEEKNFEPSEVSIELFAYNQGVSIPAPLISGWSSIGDVHQATILYDYDGEFVFDISCVDKALNQSADYQEDYFVIDRTLPEIIISGVEDQSANNDTISPNIQISDTNYEAGNTRIFLKGYQRGEITLANSKISIVDGELIKIHDFERVKESDDLYRMTAFAMDLAGNQLEKVITFSVNRFGSVYSFSESTNKLLEEYYTTNEIPIIVTETNVDTLVHQEIICNLNGKLKTLEAGRDYHVKESGSESTWKQYEYVIHEKNFMEEGHYILSLYSMDRAGNASNNQIKEKRIQFAVDKTKPSILISGVEEKGQYREPFREITVDVQDNLNLAEVKVCLNKKEYIFSGTEVESNYGKIIITAENSNDWQTIEVTSKDMAGNEESADVITFLITPNLLVQFYRNTPVFYGSMGVMLMVASIGAVCWRYKKRKGTQS